MFLALEPSFVTSRCPLLAAEVAKDFLPQVCMRVPTGSAWIPHEFDLAFYANDVGEVSESIVASALVDCVNRLDKLHDKTQWPEPSIEYDSWLNRRLAIVLRGWGDIVALRGADPTSLGTLREMEALAEWMGTLLHQRSQELARASSWCPALDEAGALLSKNKQFRPWGRRLKKAIREVAVRHRNLTTISPWDVFPRGKKADLDYSNLLPLMRFADSLSFQRDVSIAHWSVNDFKGFYGRVAAIARCNTGRGLVAKQV